MRQSRGDRILSGVLYAAGACFLLLSVVLNVSVAGALFTQDGLVDSVLVQEYFWLFRVALFVAGIVLLANKFYWRRLVVRRRQLALLLVVLAVSGVLVEIASFFIVKYSFSHHALAGKKIHYETLEFNFTAEFNANGFRDDEFEYDGAFRIALVGDSFVVGVGVQRNETLEFLLEQSLLNSTVYNLGFSGGYVEDYVAIAEEMLPRIRPTLSIFVVFLENDVVCISGSVLNSLVFPYSRSVLRHIFSGFELTLQSQRVVQDSLVQKEYKEYVRQDLVNPYLFVQARSHQNVTRNYELLLAWFGQCGTNKDMLLRLESIARRHGSAALFVFVPPSYQVSRERLDVLKKVGYDVQSTLLDESRLQHDILEFCRQKKMACLDLLPYLRNSTESSYYAWDTHFNAQGQRTARDAILQYMFTQGLASEGS